MLIQHVAEGQDHRLIRDPVAEQIHARESAHAGSLDQGRFHGRVAEGIPLLQRVDPQLGGLWIRRPATL